MLEYNIKYKISFRVIGISEFNLLEVTTENKERLTLGKKEIK